MESAAEIYSYDADPEELGPINRAVSLIIKEPQFCPRDVSQIDMKLMWWYTTCTYASFSVNGGWQGPADLILKVIIPQRAFETPFLMHVLLSLTATHVQFLKRDIEPGRVLAYRARAFAGYRNAVENPKPEEYPALLASSLLLSVVSAHMFREKETKELYIIDWIMIWRGIGLIIDLISPKALWESGMAELFYRPPLNLLAAVDHIPDYLASMVDSIPAEDEEYQFKEVYMRTLTYLGTLYMELRNGISPIMTLRVVTWFTFLPKPFVRLAREHRPIPLVILAHYLVFLKLPLQVWWIENISDREIPTIFNKVGLGYLDMMEVPLASIGVEGTANLGRLLFRDIEWNPPGAQLWRHGHAGLRRKLAFVDDTGRPLEYKQEWVVRGTDETAGPSWNYDFRETWKATLAERGRMGHPEELEGPGFLSNMDD